MSVDWKPRLARYVEKRPCAIVRLSQKECDGIAESRRGFRRFSLARDHELLDKLKVPALCFLFGKSGEHKHAYAALCTNKHATTTLQSRISFRHGFAIKPQTEVSILSEIPSKALAGILASTLASNDEAIQLSPKVSSSIISILASQSSNQQGLRSIDDVLMAPTSFSNNAALEQDAVAMALEAFGLTLRDEAVFLDVPDSTSSVLRTVSLNEDTVIEHDARAIPGFDLVASNVTGRALFQKGMETLAVFTANKKPLEVVLGVDLVYLNLTRHNMAMVQYKMLDYKGKPAGWLYRPDKQLADEIERMERFRPDEEPGPFEYRLNPCAFFLKFVKRHGAIQNGGYILPIDQYKSLIEDPKCRGERRGLRITYESLEGRFLRDKSFMSLIRCGYIGPYAATTKAFATLVTLIVRSGRAVVGAIEYPTPPEQQSEAVESDGGRAR